MNSNEFKAAFAIAASSKDLTDVSIDHLFGYGRKCFQPTATTLDAVAAVMRWQALFLNGQWDQAELNEIREIGRKKFIITDACFVLPGEYNEHQKDSIRASARMIKAII